jgi:hypothetical protein
MKFMTFSTKVNTFSTKFMTFSNCFRTICHYVLAITVVWPESILIINFLQQSIVQSFQAVIDLFSWFSFGQVTAGEG